MYIIGRLTLDTFAVEVDPATRELKPITAIIEAHLCAEAYPFETVRADRHFGAQAHFDGR